MFLGLASILQRGIWSPKPSLKTGPVCAFKLVVTFSNDPYVSKAIQIWRSEGDPFFVSPNIWSKFLMKWETSVYA